MKKLGIRSVIVRKYNPGPAKSKVDDTNKPNLLKQEFKSKKTQRKASFRYNIYLYEGIRMDLSSNSDGFIQFKCNRLQLWSKYGRRFSSTSNKERKKKGKFRKNAIFHSDLGTQYTSKKVEEYLKELKLRHSYSKKGYPYDNASMESFNAILKKEEVNLHEYETFKEAKLAIFEFIEGWYNRKRIHSSINYKVPNDIENEAT